MTSPLDAPPQGSSIKPMSVFAATGWAIATTFVFFFFLSVTHSARPSAPTDIVNGFACQAIAYLLAVFGILRVYAPQASIREFVGLRGTHPAFYALGPLLGAALEIPADALYTAIERAHPSSGNDTFFEIFRATGSTKRVVMIAIVVVLGPILEELFFRGALWKPLARAYGGATRIVVPITACLFAYAHMQWQIYPSIFLLGIVMGFLRRASGSLVPSLLLHMTFNAIPFYLVLKYPTHDAGASDPLLAPPVVAASFLVALLFLGLALLTGSRTQAAARAQELDAQ